MDPVDPHIAFFGIFFGHGYFLFQEPEASQGVNVFGDQTFFKPGLIHNLREFPFSLGNGLENNEIISGFPELFLQNIRHFIIKKGPPVQNRVRRYSERGLSRAGFFPGRPGPLPNTP